MAQAKSKVQPKAKREKMTSMLSKMVSLEEIIIDTVHEMLGIQTEEVISKMNESEFRKNLYDIHSDFYQNDPNILVASFIREGIDKWGWKVT